MLCAVPGCTCSGHVATCSGLSEGQLPAPPSGQTRSLRALVISDSALTLTDQSLRSLHWLAKLVLRNNKMDAVPSGVFRDLSNLLELDLSHNGLRVLEQGAFTGLHSLRRLHLNDNNIKSLSRSVLLPMVRLQHLDLTGNLLPDVDQDTFRASRNLKVGIEEISSTRSYYVS